VALSKTDVPGVWRLARFALITHEASRLAAFYERAFSAMVVSRQHRSGAAFERLTQVRGGAECVTVAIGDQRVELWQFEQAGRPYSHALSPYDVRFQHFAIVVADMTQALGELSSVGGWTPISTAGPQHLPRRSGGVTAFKFRDPEGHPLELLAFAAGKAPDHWRYHSRPGVFLGIDHSAISVENVRRSVSFYENLGLKIVARTLNHGLEQQRLDGVADPQVDVIALAPEIATPHIELLCYQSQARAQSPALRSNDVAATRLIFQLACRSAASIADSSERIIQDPDGHHLQIVTAYD
jgi:catechol 2,3-dioxygenase-like lactoylglutathione lyase family enzyme